MRSMHLSTVVLVLALAPASEAVRIHVDADATGAGTGLDWDNAYTDLAFALTQAASDDTVWVAEGLYRPSATGDRSATFLIDTQVRMFGGFAGDETTLAERAGLFDTTILCGDLAGDDGPDFANTDDNSFHVVTFGIFPKGIDGFTIRGGNARLSDGGGLYGPTLGAGFVRNCTFERNRAAGRGGAIFMAPADVADIVRCTFIDNHAARGGAFYGIGMTGIPSIKTSRFLGNSASEAGGAVYTSPTVIANSEFSGNSADGATLGGGAIYTPFGSLTVLACTVANNSAVGSGEGGGGILVMYDASVIGSILWGNVDGGPTPGAQLRAIDTVIGGISPIESTCIQGGAPPYGGPLDVVVGDPRFVDADGPDDVPGTVDDDLSLAFGSPCIDTGVDSPEIPADDVAGAARRVDALTCDLGGVIDMGAHERATVDGTTAFCPQGPTSFGVPAVLTGPCVARVASNDVLLTASPVLAPVGLFVFGSQPAAVPLPGGGQLCVGGRLVVVPGVAQGGALELALDLSEPSVAPLVAGTTWFVQAFFPDAGDLAATNGLALTLLD